MTFVLLITNKDDVTTDFIVRALKEQDKKYYRLNTEEIGRSVRLNFNISTKEYYLHDLILDILVDFDEVTSVYYRRPILPSPSERLSTGEEMFFKGEVNSSLEGLYKILRNASWLNSVESIRTAENKIYQLQLAEEVGLKIPTSIVTMIEDQALSFLNFQSNDCIIKPIRSGLVGDFNNEEGVIFTSKLDAKSNDLARVSACPSFIQRHINKMADVRVTVVDNEVFAVLIHSQDDKDSTVDWRKTQNHLKHTIIDLPIALKEKCIRLTKSLSLNFGALDFILTDDGEYIFLEINPNGQWAWLERLTGIGISSAIVSFLTK